MDTTFKDMDLLKSALSLKEQLFRYYSACMQARNTSVTAVENIIENKLKHALENAFTEDIMNGGAHDVKYFKGVRNISVLFLDGLPFAGFEAVRDPRLLSQLGCPLEGTYNLSDEANTLLEMINGFLSMSLKDFAEKYFSLPGLNNVNELLDKLAKLVDYKIFEFSDDAFFNSPKEFMGGYLTFSGRELLLLPSFINSNPKRFGKNAAEIVGDTAYYKGKPISSIELFFTVDHDDMDNFRMRNPSAIRILTDNNTEHAIAFEFDIPNDSEFLKALRLEIYPWYLSTFVKYDSQDAEGRKREQLEFAEEIKKILYVKDFANNFPQFNMGNSQGENAAPKKIHRGYDLNLLLKSEQARLKGRFKVTNGRYKDYNTIIYSNRHGRLMVLFDEEEHGECFYFRSDKRDFTGGDRFRACSYVTNITNIYDESDVYVPEEFMKIAEDYAERDTIIKGIYYC